MASRRNRYDSGCSAALQARRLRDTPSDTLWDSGYLRLYWSGYSDRVWLARARYDQDPLRSPWLAFALWTPSTWTMYWSEWMYVHVDPFGQLIAFYVDLRDEGEADSLTVEGAVPSADLDDEDTDTAIDGDDPDGLLRLACRVFRPDVQIDLATDQFLQQMRTEDGWDGSARGRGRPSPGASGAGISCEMSGRDRETSPRHRLLSWGDADEIAGHHQSLVSGRAAQRPARELHRRTLPRPASIQHLCLDAVPAIHQVPRLSGSKYWGSSGPTRPPKQICLGGRNEIQHCRYSAHDWDADLSDGDGGLLESSKEGGHD